MFGLRASRVGNDVAMISQTVIFHMVSMAQAHGVTMEHHAVEGQESTLTDNSHKETIT